MNSIFKEYGGAIIAAIGAVAIVLLLMTGNFGGFNGLYEALGNNMVVQSMEVDNAEMLAVRTVVSESMPAICLKRGDLYCGRYYRISDLFGATDSNGSDCEVEIYRVTDKNGNAITAGRVEIDERIDSVLFNEKGTYRIYVRCRGNKYSGQQFRIVVLED